VGLPAVKSLHGEKQLACERRRWLLSIRKQVAIHPSLCAADQYSALSWQAVLVKSGSKQEPKRQQWTLPNLACPFECSCRVVPANSPSRKLEPRRENRTEGLQSLERSCPGL